MRACVLRWYAHKIFMTNEYVIICANDAVSLRFIIINSCLSGSGCFSSPTRTQSQKPSSFVYYPIKEKWWIQDIFPSQLIDDEMAGRNRERAAAEKKDREKEWMKCAVAEKAPDIRNTNRYRSAEYLSHLWSYLCTWAPADSLTALFLFSLPQSIIDEMVFHIVTVSNWTNVY